MLRVISRPMTVPADRIALLNAGLPIILSNMPGSTDFLAVAVPWASAGAGGTYTGGGSDGSFAPTGACSGAARVAR